MYWWIITVVCICGALLVQYLCSSKILRMKQAISIKNMALRDVRSEGDRLEEQEMELKSSQTSLTQGIRRLRQDIKALVPRLKSRELEVPEPDFPLTELEEDELSPDA
jgi:chromosome segregation ATPase|tara:strand:+ start:97 stop:420 length:324 start_codon:yes stop_codon:yes gene_type:complete